MSENKPLFHYANFRIWPNRIEYTVGWWLFKRTLTLPIKKIATVDASGLTNRLTITTDDGHRHTFHVMQALKARDIVLDLL